MNDDSPVPRKRPRLVIFAGLAIVAVAVVYVYLRERGRVVPAPLTAELFYLSVTPPPPGQSSDDPAISAIRVHYFIRNSGTEDYRFPPRDRVQLMEREGVRLHPSAADVSLELPDVVPAGRQAELVIERPYAAESIPLSTWTTLYPERLPGPAGPSGTYPRLAVVVDVAQQLMKRDSLTPAKLLETFDVIADGPTRECTPLARAILQRRAPRLTGFAVVDRDAKRQIDCPLPLG